MPPILTGLRVLVVDDQASVRVLLTKVLQHAGADVTAVGSSHDALAAFERARPDVLVSDIRMPGEDGYTLLRKVRQLSEGRGGQIPAVAISASIGEDEEPRVYAAGFQQFVRKPFEPAAVRNAVATASGRAAS
jgi:CheY-like chemotaxis protein